MKRFVAALIGLLLPAWAAATPAVFDVDFTQPRAAVGWEVAHDLLPLTPTAQGLELRLAGIDPALLSPRLRLPTDRLLCLRLRLWSEFGGVGQVFVFETGPEEARSVHFEVLPEQWTTVCLPLPPAGPDARLRFDPPGTGGRCFLSQLRIEDPATAGVQHVQASRDELLVTVRAPEDLEIVEVAPHEPARAVTTAALAGRVSAGGSGTLRLPRMDGPRDRLYAGFAARRHGVPVGTTHFVEDFRGIAGNTDPYPVGVGLKGLQVQMVDDALALGIKQAVLNVNLAELIDPRPAPDSIPWRVDNRTVSLRRAAIESIPVKPLSDAGIQVTIILLVYSSRQPEVDYLMRHPRSAPDAPNGVVAFNTHTVEGVAHLRACVECLAERFSAPDGRHGRVTGWVVGNEVNSHRYWYNLGPLPFENVAGEYLKAFRVVHTAIRRSAAHARVYLSLDHFWERSFDGSPLQSAGGRFFLDYFQRLCRLGGDLDWHVAHHPYPGDLFEPRSWLDVEATHRPDAPWISYRNLEQLTGYLGKAEMRYRGEPRRIILSEQGFHTPRGAEGQRLQAAGFCYAYRRVVALGGIDAFILHRHVDHRLEGGLACGLWTREPDSVATAAEKKMLYDVFRRADTDDWQDAFAFALPLIGISDWAELGARPPR